MCVRPSRHCISVIAAFLLNGQAAHDVGVNATAIVSQQVYACKLCLTLVPFPYTRRIARKQIAPTTVGAILAYPVQVYLPREVAGEALGESTLTSRGSGTTGPPCQEVIVCIDLQMHRA